MKHPVLTNGARLIIWWLVWLLLTLGQLLLYYYAYGKLVSVFIAGDSISMIIYSGIALSLWYPFRYFNAGEARPVAIISNLLAGGTIAIGLWILTTKLLFTAILPRVSDFANYWSITFPYRIFAGAFIYGLIVLAYYLFVSLYNLSEKNVKEARLEALIKETELKMLRSQINPHFLFNSLNSVSSLTITDPDRAREMVIKLSEFMRYALSKKDEQPVSLRSELENLRLYLDIEKVRFGDKLNTEENIEEKCLDIKMPVMILQPLFENAIKHGVYESTEIVYIKTSVSCDDGYLRIIISNTYDPAPSSVKGTGTGLRNVSRRLALFYGNKASINSVKENGMYTVTLFIPASI